MDGDGASGGRGGLVRAYRRKDVIYIGENGEIEVHVVKCGANSVDLRIKAPREVKIKAVDAPDIAAGDPAA